MIDVLEIISSIEEEKKTKKIEPSYALYSEISAEVSNRVKKELNQGVMEGKIGWNETLNSISFTIKNNQ